MYSILFSWDASKNTGITLSTVKKKTVVKSDDPNKSRVYARWIAVALNKEDAAQLLSEPHLDGLVNGGQQPCGCDTYNKLTLSGLRMDENIFCVHPYEQVRSDL